jgi:tetratricopeptide (TPR) repeat protein
MDILALRTPAKLDRPAQIAEGVDRAAIRELYQLVMWSSDVGQLTDAVSVALHAWALYACGLLDGSNDLVRRAAALYESAPELTFPGIDVEVSQPWKRWRAAAIAHHDAGDIDKAVRAGENWAALSPEPAAAYRKMAELLWRLERPVEAVEAFMKAVGEEPSDRIWEDSLILKLALECQQGDATATAIQQAAAKSKFREQGEQLVTWLLPWFSQLSDDARGRLWFGLFALSSPEVQANTAETAWYNAADNFGESLAFELKHAVFAPFFREHRGIDPPDDHWRHIRNGKGTLGQLIQVLLTARHPVTAAATALQGWLNTNRPYLLNLLRNPQPLHRVYQLRGRAQHDRVDTAAVREVFRTVCEALSAIHRKSNPS